MCYFFCIQKSKLAITDTTPYVPIVTLSTQDNSKLFQQVKSRFKKAIKWNKYQSIVTTERQNLYLNFLINPSFQGVNRIFVLSFKNDADRKIHTKYYLSKIKIKYWWKKRFWSAS